MPAPRYLRMPSKWLVTAALLGPSACIGNIGDDTPSGGPGSDVGKTAEALCKEHGPMPGPMPRLTRLTHPQYDNTIRDLFGKTSSRRARSSRTRRSRASRTTPPASWSRIASPATTAAPPRSSPTR